MQEANQRDGNWKQCVCRGVHFIKPTLQIIATWLNLGSAQNIMWLGEFIVTQNAGTAKDWDGKV